jgi:hypothetical protein
MTSIAPSTSTNVKKTNVEIEEFLKNIDTEEKFVWLCYDCRQFMYTKEYSKDHKRCWADLVENMYEDMKKTNEDNLESVKGMCLEFKEESEFVTKKFHYTEDNNPFEMNLKLVNKIYDNIIDTVNKKREEAIERMTALRDNYMKNIQQNILKINGMIERSDEVSEKLNSELDKMKSTTPINFCKELLNSNVSSDLADDCNDIAIFQRQEFTRIKQSFIDTNTIVYNDSNAVIDQAKNLREFLIEKINNFYSNYSKYQSKYAFTVVMNMKEFIVYLIDSNKVTKVSYVNDFVIPCYARWVDISGDKLILTGGEKDYIESLNSCYMFKFRKFEGTDEGFSAKVFHKASMNYRRRAHSLIYFNDFM